MKTNGKNSKQVVSEIIGRTKTCINDCIAYSDRLIADLQEVRAFLEALGKRLDWIKPEIHSDSNTHIDDRMLSALYNIVDSIKHTALNYEDLGRYANVMVGSVEEFAEQVEKLKEELKELRA